MKDVIEHSPRSVWSEGRQAMPTPEDVQVMVKLASLGWRAKRISRELGCSCDMVRSNLRQGGWQPYESPRRWTDLPRVTMALRENVFMRGINPIR